MRDRAARPNATRILAVSVAVVCGLVPLACAPSVQTSLSARTNFLHGSPALNADGTLNVVVEIPAGTNEKWEVAKSGSSLDWELHGDRRRVVAYLPYPGNYGMVPRTLLPESAGGDGDPLDAIVLGPAIPRGQIVRARPVAVLRLLDEGERDDKIVAISTRGPLREVDTLRELEALAPGATTILETWFSHYKGEGRVETSGFADEARARAVIEEAVAAFAQSRAER
jgi:inorganic pyrophosphatase